MIKKNGLTIFAATLLMLSAISVYGRGTPDDAWKEVDGVENWEHEVDLTEIEPGTRNIIIRSQDYAGNEYIEGPFNIEIDPESDKPVSRIIYPESEEIVRGAVDIVGVAMDDDGVERVEVRVNDGGWEKVEGKEYWRYQIGAERLKNGVHTLDVRAVDINGLKGDVFTTDFILDTEPPLMGVDSHPSGAIVNGKVTFEGNVRDANRIQKLELSRDGRETYEELKVKEQRGEEAETFRFDVRTDREEDGPQVYWLQATDETGAVSQEPYLFFIDNESPRVEIAEPSEGEPVNGIVEITGSIKDRVGVNRFWYVWKEEEHEIPLVPGNPYWNINIDTRKADGKYVDVTFYAEDSSGNTTTIRHRMENNQESAKPSVVIETPRFFDEEKPVESVGPETVIYGRVEGEYTPSHIEVTGIEEEKKEYPAYPSFAIPLEELPPGKVDLGITPVDDLGYRGEEVRLRFTRRAEAPVIEFEEIRYGDDQTKEYIPGVQYDTLREGQLYGTIRTKADLDEVEILFGQGEGAEKGEVSSKRTEDPGVKAFTCSIPTDYGYGEVPLTVSVTDEYGTVADQKGLLFFRDLRRTETDPMIWVEDERIKTDGRVVFTGDNPLSARLIGVEGGGETRFQNCRLEPDPDFLTLQKSGDILSIYPVNEGTAEDVYLRAETDEGIELEAGPFDFTVDNTAPQIDLENVELPTVKGTVTEDSRIAKAEISHDGGENFEELSLRRSSGKASFQHTFDLPEETEDGYAVVVRIRDEHGNISVARRVINMLSEEPLPSGDEAEGRDNDSPDIEILTPRGGGVVYTSPQVGGVIRDLDGTQYVEISVDGGEYRRAESYGERRHHQEFLLDLSNLEPGEHEVSLRAADRHAEAAVSREERVKFTLKYPPMEIALDSVGGEENLVEAKQGFRVPLGESVPLRGSISGAARLDKLRWRIGMEDWDSAGTDSNEEVKGEELFEIDLPKDLPYGRHILEIEAVDEDGLKTHRRAAFTVVDPADPPPRRDVLSFEDPRVDGGRFVLTDEKPVTGRWLGRPIDSAELIGDSSLFDISVIDNSIRLRPLGQGTAEEVGVRIKTVDGIEFTTPMRSVMIDSKEPELRLLKPEPGYFSSGKVTLEGILADEVGVEDLTYRIGVDGRERPLDAEISEEGAFSYTVDLTGRDSGPLQIFLFARDSAGKEAQEMVPVVYDPHGPEIRYVTPASDDIVNGLTSVIARVESLSPITELSYRIGEEEDFQDLPVGRLESGESIDHEIDFSVLHQEDKEVVFRAVDEAGNMTESSPQVQVNLEDDLPVVEIQIPEKDAVTTNNFTISGMAFDDDAVDAIYWRIDEGDFQELPGGNSFSVDMEIDRLTDNEHTIEAYAVDEYGLKGKVQARTIQVSLDEPETTFDSPTVEETNRETVRLEGSAYDENGIKDVLLSFDNGTTFQRARFAEEDDTAKATTRNWHYDLNTTIFEDGTYSVQIITVDKYDISSKLFSLINIDNTSPVVDLTKPVDKDVVSQELDLSGRVDDNIGVESLLLEVAPINRDGEKVVKELSTRSILQDTVDISGLKEGWFNIRLTAKDAAENETVKARNIYVQDDVESTFVTLLFPQDGTDASGQLIVEGRAQASVPVNRVQIYLDGNFVDGAAVNSRGYFRYVFPEEAVSEGEHEIQAYVEPASSERVASEAVQINYEETGPYVQITSHQAGDFVSSRPWISGVAEYRHFLDEEDRDNRKALRELEVDDVYVSINNGRTFDRASGGDEWKYRIETGEVPDGPLAVMVRAEFKNGETAVSRTRFTVDKSPPEVTLLSPHEDALLNTTLNMEGTASDEHGIKSIEAALRKGDKSSYSVPGFVQGMYFDSHTLGLTYFQVGLGLTFFDENVKLQGHYGKSPKKLPDGQSVRFAGHFLGGKLLANVAALPFNFFLGPDWEFLSMNMALGATFNYISLYDPIVPPSGDESAATSGLVLSAILAQLEFPKVSLKEWGTLNAYSLYTEPQLWFIPSDASPAMVFKLTFGCRVQLF